ncbi:Glyoxalase-like domain protein [compost metagenome]
MIQLGYFTLDTPDVDRARAFYGALFGWRFDEGSSSPTYAHVADGAPPFGFTKGERTDFPHLYFRVDDIEATCARVVELGGKAAVPAESPSGLSAVVCDDQDVSFSLWQPAPGY